MDSSSETGEFAGGMDEGSFDGCTVHVSIFQHMNTEIDDRSIDDRIYCWLRMAKSYP